MYVLRQFDIPYFRNMLRTFSDVHDSWVRKMSENGLAAMNFTEPCHHVVKFVDWVVVLIEPVNLHVFVVFVSDALDASLRNFDVLQFDNARQYPIARVES